jgi:hypothetical protein
MPTIAEMRKAQGYLTVGDLKKRLAELDDYVWVNLYVLTNVGILSGPCTEVVPQMGANEPFVQLISKPT